MSRDSKNNSSPSIFKLELYDDIADDIKLIAELRNDLDVILRLLGRATVQFKNEQR
jgi:hypothetical protein